MRLETGAPGPMPTQLLGRPACPRCGEALFAATATEFLGAGRIQNTWSCENCDHQFRSMVAVPSDLL